MDKNENPIYIIIDLWKELSNRRKKQSFVLLIFMIFTGTFELLTIGLITPFLYLLQNPNIDKNTTLKSNNLIGFVNFIDLNNIFILSGLFIFVIISLCLLRLFVLWYGGQLTARIGCDLGSRAYKKVLQQPYQFHLKQNSSNLISTINGHTDECIGALVALLQLCTGLVVLFFILTALTLLNPTGALSSILVFASLYLIIGYWSKVSLKNNSIAVASARVQQMKALQEGLGGIREILLDHSQDEYYSLFKKSSYVLRIKTAFNQFLASFPRFALESLGFLLITILGIVITNSETLRDYTIPILGTIALAAQRLLPTLQQIYSGWANAKAANVSFYFLRELLSLPENEVQRLSKSFKFKNSIEFKNVHFKYEGTKKSVFSDLNFEIKAGSKIGILGPSGGGKTTFADLIMGLLSPTKGLIYVDGKLLEPKNNKHYLREWRSTISHVPQNIFLTDNTIGANITFGIDKEEINNKLLIKAASQAQLLDFIKSLPDGFNTKVGERGVRLSGGQRQRIGIARALYKQASVIVLDEATSALDNENEASVMNAIDKLSNNITLIMIAHRISTLKHCQRIISIKKGGIIELDKNKIF